MLWVCFYTITHKNSYYSDQKPKTKQPNQQKTVTIQIKKHQTRQPNQQKNSYCSDQKSPNQQTHFFNTKITNPWIKIKRV